MTKSEDAEIKTAVAMLAELRKVPFESRIEVLALVVRAWMDKPEINGGNQRWASFVEEIT